MTEKKSGSCEKKRSSCGPDPFVSVVLASCRGVERNVSLNSIYFNLIAGCA